MKRRTIKQLLSDYRVSVALHPVVKPDVARLAGRRRARHRPRSPGAPVSGRAVQYPRRPSAGTGNERPPRNVLITSASDIVKLAAFGDAITGSGKLI